MKKPAPYPKIFPGQKRVKGRLEPVYRVLGIRRARDLAERIGVTRQTIYRWQRGCIISPYYRQQLDLLLVAHGAEPMFEGI